jgi:hypothetical protein
LDYGNRSRFSIVLSDLGNQIRFGGREFGDDFSKIYDRHRFPLGYTAISQLRNNANDRTPHSRPGSPHNGTRLPEGLYFPFPEYEENVQYQEILTRQMAFITPEGDENRW